MCNRAFTIFVYFIANIAVLYPTRFFQAALTPCYYFLSEKIKRILAALFTLRGPTLKSKLNSNILQQHLPVFGIAIPKRDEGRESQTSGGPFRSFSFSLSPDIL